MSAINGAGGFQPRIVQGGATGAQPGNLPLLPEDNPAVRMAVRRAAAGHATPQAAVSDMVRAVLPRAGQQEVDRISQAILGSQLMGSVEAIFAGVPRGVPGR